MKKSVERYWIQVPVEESISSREIKKFKLFDYYIFVSAIVKVLPIQITKHKVWLVLIFHQGLWMAQGEIVALRANVKSGVSGQESEEARKTNDIQPHAPSS